VARRHSAFVRLVPSPVHLAGTIRTVTVVASPELVPLRERAAIMDGWLRDRLDHIVPMLMQRHGLDAWVLVAREYNEDPVLRTMLPATWMGARRRTILVFTHGGSQRHAVTRYAVGDLFASAWDPTTQPDQWQALHDLLVAADPGSIAVDVSPTFALADGMTHTDHGLLSRALGSLADRMVSAEPLAVGWLETRTDGEVTEFRTACSVAHGLLRRALSGEVVTPGSTTTDDVGWWLREEVAGLRLVSWFHPSVSVQRATDGRGGSFATRPEDTVILPGDLVHIDFGLTYLGLNTDQQQHAYILRPGETAAPDGLRRALAASNRAQDLLMAEFVEGRTGNEVLAAALQSCRRVGLDATIYTHPLGLHGHAAGATIGLWDQQDRVSGAGDWPINVDSAWSIELSTVSKVPEWGDRPVRAMLEEDAFFDGSGIAFLDGRQTELWLIPSE
jgi:Xaa-Pro aminopeptidase